MSFLEPKKKKEKIYFVMIVNYIDLLETKVIENLKRFFM